MQSCFLLPGYVFRKVIVAEEVENDNLRCNGMLLLRMGFIGNTIRVVPVIIFTPNVFLLCSSSMIYVF